MRIFKLDYLSIPGRMQDTSAVRWSSYHKTLTGARKRAAKHHQQVGTKANPHFEWHESGGAKQSSKWWQTPDLYHGQYQITQLQVRT